MNNKNIHRHRVIATMLVSMIFLIALIVFQNAAAIQQHSEPITLNPPFKFQVDDGVTAASAFPSLPISATHLLTETFGDNYQQTGDLTGTTPAWRYYVDSDDMTDVYWNRVISMVTNIYTDTAWASCGICNGGIVGSLNPDTDDYPDGQGAWLVYGPVTLKNYYAAEATFNYWIDVRAGDAFWFGVSNDGTTFTGSPVPFDGAFSSGGWLTHTFNLGNYAGVGKPSVYLGFYFDSNTDTNTAKGVFIDNVHLRAAPYLQTHLPLTAKNFAVATPPPVYLNNYTFGSGTDQNNADVVAWGGVHDYSSGLVGQGLTTGGNPSGNMFLYAEATYDIALAGPNINAPTNFEISVDLKVSKDKNKARYGVVFGAESGTFGRTSGGKPTYNFNTDYYKFGLRFPDSGSQDVPTHYRLERCDGDGRNCATLVNNTAFPSNLVDGVWDTVTIRRQGSSIFVWVNGTLLIDNFIDGTYVGGREFGVYIQSQEFNSASDPLKINWDNFRVSQLP